MLIESFLFLLPGHDLILQRDPRILVNHKYLEGGRAQSVDGMRLDLADTQHILKDSFSNFPLVFVSLLFVLQIGCVGKLLQQVGEMGLMMDKMDSVAVPSQLFVVRHDVDVVP